ncbi:MAG: YfhO family protein [Armatimonadetes bacterium]|nr:YfhO family protein [Armatimonadota bacterium]
MSDQNVQNSAKIEQEAKPIRCWTVALWAAAIALLAMLPTIVRYKGLYVFRSDFIKLFVPKLIEFKRLITSGTPWYSHNVGLGEGVGALLSGSPFFCLLMVFLEKWFLWAIGYSIVPKFIVSACFAFIALRMFVKSRSAAVAALLYTYSGFTVINSEYHLNWADVIAVFPLLIIGIECILRKRRYGFGIFALVVMINALTNVYMFAASSLFLFLYIGLRMLGGQPNHAECRWLLLTKVLCGYLLGAVGASVVLCPTTYYIFNSPRASLHNISRAEWVFYMPQRYLELTRVFFMPIEGHTQHAFYPYTANWASSGIHLPVFGVTLALVYLARYRNWLSKLIIICVIMSFVPLTNSAFNGFTNVIYTRWWFVLAFMLALATAKIIDELDSLESSKLRGYYLISLLICGVLTVPIGIINMFPNIYLYLYNKLGINVLDWLYEGLVGDSSFGGRTLMLYALMLCIFNYILLWFVLFHKLGKKLIFLCVALASIVNFAAFIQIENRSWKLDFVVNQVVAGTDGLDIVDQQFWRIDYPHFIANYGWFTNLSSPNVFISTRNPYAAEFQNVSGCGATSGVGALMPFNRPALRSLLSVKYFVNYDPENFKLTMPGYKFVKETAGTQIYENEYFVPMGFSYDTYISEGQLSQYSDCIEKVMLKAVVLSDDQIEKYGSDMEQYAADVKKCADFDWMADAQEMKKHTCSDYTADSKGFAARIELDAPKMVFFSVPYGAGWNAFVDGKPAQIEKVNIGFLGLMLPAGQHDIEFRYFPPGLRLGAIVSGVSVIILFGYFIIAARIWRRKNGEETLGHDPISKTMTETT